MCTAATYQTKHFYFGRNLDYEQSFGESVVITPRNWPLALRHGAAMETHYAMIGMAHMQDGFPLYYDAVNEKGLCIAGLNFVGNAVYGRPEGGRENVAQFELIPWLLGRCATLAEARQLLQELSRAEQYIGMVMVYLRLTDGGSDFVLRTCDLDTIVRQAVRRFAGEFITRKLKLCYEPLNAACVTDEKWLLFVIEQVLSNALKYTPEGTVSVYLERPKTLCIRDTGIGIAPEDLPRVFENGYTGYNGRSDKKASGIGLYLCRRICNKLGHTISAESKAGEGTVIRIGLDKKKLEIE